MILDYPETDLFKKQMRESLRREIRNSRGIKIPSHQNVYTIGEHDEMIYFIRRGRVKLSMISSEGRECLLAIHGAGDVFGESCLSGLAGRPETATAMEDTLLKTVPCARFLKHLAADSLLEGFVKYLAVRVAGQQEVIANLVTIDSEQRLGKTLLQLAKQLGKKGPGSTRIELKISHEELSNMIGTTRPRVSVFMQRFRNLGLIDISEEHYLIVLEDKLTTYLASIT
jgi:CRP/FNR family cyclic AMP-dependent transcriptional regulator